jgi:hypothetical protein
MHRLIFAFALCLAVLAGAQPAAAQTPNSAIPVQAIIHPQVLADAIRLPFANVIPVAVLSSETFDSTKIDPASLILAAPALNLIATTNAAHCEERDINADGLVDLVCQFELAHLSIGSGFLLATLQGQTADGIEIRADVPVNVVPDHSFQIAPKDREIPR